MAGAFLAWQGVPQPRARRAGPWLARYAKHIATPAQTSPVLLKLVPTWEITDAHTWLNGEDARKDHLPERCLPFDAELNPVQAFFGVRDALDRRPGS
jgi:GH35 family endo-1,4-beta-xylanase